MATTDMAQQWMKYDTHQETREEVQQLLDSGKLDQLSDLVDKRLEFGTAGLRGKMGAGFNRMNHVTVQQTAQGLCSYLQQQEPQLLASGGIAVGYDGRHHSKEYAHITAGVFLSQGVRVHLFGDMVPTPFVAAAVSELRCAAGVMVTASHNPKEYNGYKVYWGNGCQIIPPHDHGIAAAIEQNLDLWRLPPVTPALPASGGAVQQQQQQQEHQQLLSDPTQQVTAAYFARLAGLHHNAEATNARLGQLVYTPLHGVGGQAMLRAFQVMSLPAPYIVPEQRDPDPEFPTVVFPNPEEGKGTWALAFRAGEAQGARLVMANDPDADRLSVAERNPAAPGGWQVFSGNEIGALLAHWLWRRHRALSPKSAPLHKAAMLASTVSSKMLASMASREGFHFEETLTGFKWLGNTALELEAAGYEVLFAFEEAIGFMVGGMYKDKDGICAGSVFCEMAAATYASGSTLGQQLEALYQRYGYFVFRSNYFIADQPAKSRAVFEELRRDGRYATQLAGVRVLHVRDLGTGLDTSQPSLKAKLPWQPGDMAITYTLEGNATLTLRASGTEPKLKYYLEVSGSERAQAAKLADAIEAELPQLIGVERHKLLVPAPQ